MLMLTVASLKPRRDSVSQSSARNMTFIGLRAGCVEVEVKLQAEEEGSQFGIQTSTFQIFHLFQARAFV